MKTITLTVSDNYYDTFMAFFKNNPNVTFDEKEYNTWQEAMIMERAKNAKPEDYESWEDVKKELDKKFNFNG